MNEWQESWNLWIERDCEAIWCQPLFLHLLTLIFTMDKKSYTGTSSVTQELIPVGMHLGKLDLHAWREMRKGTCWAWGHKHSAPCLGLPEGLCWRSSRKITMQYILLGCSVRYGLVIPYSYILLTTLYMPSIWDKQWPGQSQFLHSWSLKSLRENSHPTVSYNYGCAIKGKGRVHRNTWKIT